MVKTAQANAHALGLSDNVTFLVGQIDDVVLPPSLVSARNSADMVISNGVFNLTDDKARAFQLAYDLLAPGGRFQLADVVKYEGPSSFKKND